VKVLSWKSRFAWSLVTVRHAFRAWTGRNVLYSITFQGPMVNMCAVRFSTKSSESFPYDMFGCAFDTILTVHRDCPPYTVCTDRSF